MSLQPLPLANHPHICVRGDVVIDPSAAIAPGAILHAAPNCQIWIGPGVCLGMGVVLNACRGNIRLETGVSLGPGVLIVGESTVGANTCVGGATTVYEANVAAMQVIGAGRVIGDTSRQVSMEVQVKESTSASAASVTDDLWDDAQEATLPASDSSPSPVQEEVESTEEVVEQEAPEPPPEEENLPASRPWSSAPPQTTASGKVYVNRLLLTLFPQGQQGKFSHNSAQDSSSESSE